VEEILHHLGWLKPYEQWDKPPINWCQLPMVLGWFLAYIQGTVSSCLATGVAMAPASLGGIGGCLVVFPMMLGLVYIYIICLGSLTSIIIYNQIVYNHL
jgi:ABC-type Co2+ transport system permease subunit